MSLIPSIGKKEVKPGTIADWFLAFHEESDGKVAKAAVLEIGSRDYFAEIQATLPGGLEGGSYSFVIEGLTDDHYAKISQVAHPEVNVVRLYLSWRDSGLSLTSFVKPLADLVDSFSSLKEDDVKDFLVAELRIVGVTRKAGTRRYETTITCRERVFEVLSQAQVSRDVAQAAEVKEIKEALQTVLDKGKLLKEDSGYIYYPLKDPKNTTGGLTESPRSIASSQSAKQLVQHFAQRLEEQAELYGRGMLLIRDGVLHVGQRAIPFAGKDPAEPKKLTVRAGLVETEVLDTILIDSSPSAQVHRRFQFRLTLKGRPDLKPGDVVVTPTRFGDRIRGWTA